MIQIRRALLLAAAILPAACATPTADPPSAQAPVPAAPAAPAAPGGRDAAALRLALLRAMDAQIEEDAARAHLNARLTLDRTMPLPYLGVDADPEGEGMLVRKVYPLTGAERAGLREGDLLLSLGGDATVDPKSLGAAIRSRRVGDGVEIRARRGTETLTLAGTLGPRGEEDEDEAEQFPFLAEAGPPSSGPASLDFEGEADGAAPAGIVSLLGGHGRAGDWRVRRDGGGSFVRQVDDDPTGIRFPMAILRGFESQDAVVRTRFRYSGGKADRAAGVVVRFRNPWTYLVARVNAIEGDLRIFRVEHGLRTTIPGGKVDAPCDDDRWHTLEIRAEGPRITAVLDGSVTVTTFDTSIVGGRAGVWTKSDSVTDFDDLRAEAIPAAPKAEGR